MKLILLRHGQSTWNEANKFTGWTDVDLSESGIEQAKKAGQLIKSNGFKLDIAYTSYLKRAIKTLWLVLEKMDLMWLRVQKSWRLNERHYGALQGLNKAETVLKFGEEQVNLWRRSFSVRPPLLESADARNPAFEEKYQHLKPTDVPLGESLEDTLKRLMPYWLETIQPQILDGKTVLVVAHGNSIRGIIDYLEKATETEIADIDIPTGQPLVYELDTQGGVLQKYYLE